MKKFILSILLISATFTSNIVFADQYNGLNVIVTSADRQAQMIAMVLSYQTMKTHEKKVHMVLCGPAGELALSSTKTEEFKPIGKSPTQLLNSLIKMGASIKLCPIYLPSIEKSESDLIDGITVAKPPIVAGKILDSGYTTLSF